MALNKIALDSNKNIIYNPKPLAIRQGEKGIVLYVVLTSNAIRVNAARNLVLGFEATKPDGTIVLDDNQNNFAKNDNGFTYTLHPNCFQAVGNIKAHFVLKQVGGVVDTTSDFSIKVLPATGKDLISSDYISAAETIVEESKKKLQQVIDVVTTATNQINLTKTNLTGDVSKFLSDTKTSVNSNVKTLTDNLNQLKNTFDSNIKSVQGVFESNKKNIDDWFLEEQSKLLKQKQSIDSEWSAKKAEKDKDWQSLKNGYDTKINDLKDDFNTSKSAFESWLNKTQSDMSIKQKNIDSEWSAKKAEKDNDWLKLKASYDSKINGLTTQYQVSVDQQKKQLSDDLASFKTQLKSQLDSTQSTINQLKNTDVPSLSKKLDDIKKNVDNLDLSTIYDKKTVDQKTLAMKNQAVNEVKELTDTKATFKMLTPTEAEELDISKSTEMGTFYALADPNIKGLTFGLGDGETQQIFGYMRKLKTNDLIYNHTGNLKDPTANSKGNFFNINLPSYELSDVSGIAFNFMSASGKGYNISDEMFDWLYPDAYKFKLNGKNYIKISKDDLFTGSTLKFKTKKMNAYSGSTLIFSEGERYTTIEIFENKIKVTFDGASESVGLILGEVITY